MINSAADPYQELLSRRARRGPRPPFSWTGPRFNFGAGKPDPGSFPTAELAHAMSDVMELDAADALTYGPLYGYEGLRDLIAHKYRVFEGLDVPRDDILITNGSNDAIALVIQALVDEGDLVICEAPTYMVTLTTLRRNGAEVVGIEVDHEGMRTDLLANKLEELHRSGRRCKLIYTIDTFQNPSGPSLSERRRRELVELAQRYGVVVLEDDAYGELRFEGTPTASLYALDDSGLVCRTGTLSKILGAGVRLGWVMGAPSLLGYVSAFNFGGGVSPLTSRICTVYLEQHLESHVKELIPIYRAKRDAMLDELEQGLGDTDASWSRPEGGFFTWIKLPTGTDLERLAELAAASSVGYVAGPAFMPNGGGEEYIRLAFSYEAPDELREGTRLLCAAIRAASARS